MNTAPANDKSLVGAGRLSTPYAEIVSAKSTEERAWKSYLETPSPPNYARWAKAMNGYMSLYASYMREFSVRCPTEPQFIAAKVVK